MSRPFLPTQERVEKWNPVVGREETIAELHRMEAEHQALAERTVALGRLSRDGEAPHA